MKKSLSLRIVSLLLTFALHNLLLVITARASETNPKIVFTHVGNIWNNVSNGSSNAVYYSPTGSDLFVSCTAPYPIQWNISGIIAPAEIVKMLPPKRNLHENVYDIRTNFFFLSGNGYAGLMASAQIACEKIGDQTVRDHFSVFVRGNNPFVEPATKIVTDSKLIPCPTTDPSSPTMLYLQASDGVEGLVNDVTYNPVEGFRSNNVFDGIYTCRKESSYITITANTTQPLTNSTVSDYLFSPSVELIKAFSDEPIEFTCSSKTKSIKLKLEDNTNASLTYSVDNDKTKTAKLSLPEGLDEQNVQGKVMCITNDEKELKIKEWSFEFIDAPELYLDNFEGEVDCLSPLTPKMVQTVRCRNSMDCQFMDHCFQNESRCNFKKQKQFFTTDDTYCWIEKLGNGRACASVPYSHLNGRVQCTVGGLTKKYDFFVSLDFYRYSNWKDAAEKELLRMDATSEVLYTEGSTRFFCTGSAYLFADSLSFEIEFKNRTKRLLKDDGKVVNISNPYSENSRKIDEFNVLGVLDINLPIDAIAINCIAPWWNSTDIMTTSSKFETRQLLAPVMSDVNENLLKEVLYTYIPNQRFACFAEGEPQPKYQWFFRNDTKSEFTNAEEVFPTLTTSLGSNGKGYLEFASVSDMNAGEFKCVATNSLGSVLRIFQVQVSDKKKPCLE